MKKKSEIILEGSYQYTKNNVKFAKEDFKIFKIADHGEYHLYADILSQIQSEEILKVSVHYVFNENFLPVHVQIEKAISNKYILEKFNIDSERSQLKYELKTNSSSQNFKMAWSEEFHLSSPAFSSSTLWIKRISDNTKPLRLTTIISLNDWHYDSPPEKKVIHTRLKNDSIEGYQLNNVPLTASLWELSSDEKFEGQQLITSLFTGRDFSLPYELMDNNLKITLTNLIRHT